MESKDNIQSGRIKLDPNCIHDLKSCGCWDGCDDNGNWIAGTLYRCTKCGGISHSKDGK